MKPRVLAVLLIALALARPAPSHALGVDLGIKGGVAVSKVRSDILDAANRTGFVGGLDLGVGLSPGLAIQPELLYVRKGVKLPGLFGDFDVDYVEFPLLLRLSLLPGSPVDVRLLGGPVASFKASTPSLDQVRTDVTHLKAADYGLAIGAAVAVRPGGSKVVAEGRYTFGLSDAFALTETMDLTTTKVRNRSIYLTLGLEFPLIGR